MLAGQVLTAEALVGLTNDVYDGVVVQGSNSSPLDFTVTGPALVPGRRLLVIAYAIMGSGSLASATRAQWSLGVVGSPTTSKTIRSAYPGNTTTGLGFDGIGVFETPPAASGSITVRLSYSGDGMGRGLTVTWSNTLSSVQVIHLGPT